MPSRRGGAIGPDNLPPIIDPQSGSRCSPRHIDRAEGAVGVEEPVILSTSDVLPNDLAAVVKSKNLRQRRPRKIDRAENPAKVQEPMVRTACEIDPYDLTRIVHGGRPRARGARGNKTRQRSFVEKKTGTTGSGPPATLIP